jgi:methionyl-tRNA formyltransferase
MKRCVIACSKVWVAEVAERVARATGCSCELVTSKEGLSVAMLEAVKPELVFFPHWSWKIPREIFEHWECVIFHMTDLPYGRGGSPLQNLILRGHRQTFITALRCAEEMDGGLVYMKRPLSLQGSAQDIYVQATYIIEDMMREMLIARPQAAPQVGEPVHFSRRRPDDGDISRLSTVSEVYDYIRMLDAEGYPPAFIDTEHLRLTFNRAQHRGERVLADVIIQRKSDG